MPGIDASKEKLVGATQAIEMVERAALTAVARGSEVTTSALRTGLVGTVKSFLQVSGAIADIRVRVKEAGEAIGQARVRVSQAPSENTVGDSIHDLRPAVDVARAARDRMRATMGAVDGVIRLVAAILRDGQPGPMIAALTEIGRAAGVAAKACDEASDELLATIAQAGQVGAAGTAGN